MSRPGWAGTTFGSGEAELLSRDAQHEMPDGALHVHVASSSLLARAGQCLGQVCFLAAHAASGKVRRELYAVEAEAAILMGQLVWDVFQRRDHASARMYLDQAIDAARQVRDPAAEGLALLRKAMIALYGERNPRGRPRPCRADG